jgi:hypothetical protein
MDKATKAFIETFRWQSGKSLKQNLIDLSHRFWDLSFLREEEKLFRLPPLFDYFDQVLSRHFFLTRPRSFFVS